MQRWSSEPLATQNTRERKIIRLVLEGLVQQTNHGRRVPESMRDRTKLAARLKNEKDSPPLGLAAK